MSRFTVGWRDEALHELTEVWLASTTRDAISASANEVDAMLSANPRRAGKGISEGLRRLDVYPLHFYFIVNEDDCKVEIIKVRAMT